MANGDFEKYPKSNASSCRTQQYNKADSHFSYQQYYTIIENRVISLYRVILLPGSFSVSQRHGDDKDGAGDYYYYSTANCNH